MTTQPNLSTTTDAKEIMQLFVYIIESPSDADIYHKRFEADLLEKVCALTGASSFSRPVVSEIAFKFALKDFKDQVLSGPVAMPILHISAHGNSEGIEITGGTFIPWSKLKEELVPINKALGGILILCMSSCEGLAACQMAMSLEDKDPPFLVMVGSSSQPTWSETAVAYLAFYHHLQKGSSAPVAVTAMRAASGNNNFFVNTAEEARQGYLKFVRQNAPRPSEDSTPPILNHNQDQQKMGD
jgi:hypothetical protein